MWGRRSLIYILYMSSWMWNVVSLHKTWLWASLGLGDYCMHEKWISIAGETGGESILIQHNNKYVYSAPKLSHLHLLTGYCRTHSSLQVFETRLIILQVLNWEYLCLLGNLLRYFQAGFLNLSKSVLLGTPLETSCLAPTIWLTAQLWLNPHTNAATPMECVRKPAGQ